MSLSFKCPKKLVPQTPGKIARYAFFGVDEVAEFFRGASADPVLSTWNDDTEVTANRRYCDMVPDDSHLVARFEEVFRERPEQFAPLGPA